MAVAATPSLAVKVSRQIGFNCGRKHNRVSLGSESGSRLNDDARLTMPLGLLKFIGTSGRAQGSPWHLIMAVSAVMMVPIVVLCFLAKKRFIERITTSGVNA